MNKNKISILFLLILVGFSGHIFAKGQTGESGKIIIAVSILPQQYFLTRIAGDRVESMVLVGEGQSPHSYDPSPLQMNRLSKAGAWILSGTDFEIGLEPKIHAQFPDLLLVHSTEGITFRELEEHHHEGDLELEESEHENNIDKHTWLGRDPAKIIATHILDVLIKVDPAGRDIYEANYLSLIKDIDTEFDDLKLSLSSFSGQTVLVFHPAFGYFLDEFNLHQESIETGGKEPTPKVLKKLIDTARDDKASAIFVQAQFPVRAAKTVADAVGAEVVLLDPLDPDWLANIRTMGDALKCALALKE